MRDLWSSLWCILWEDLLGDIHIISSRIKLFTYWIDSDGNYMIDDGGNNLVFHD